MNVSCRIIKGFGGFDAKQVEHPCRADFGDELLLAISGRAEAVTGQSVEPMSCAGAVCNFVKSGGVKLTRFFAELKALRQLDVIKGRRVISAVAAVGNINFFAFAIIVNDLLRFLDGIKLHGLFDIFKGQRGNPFHVFNMKNLIILIYLKL